jgi:hypothetical protein
MLSFIRARIGLLSVLLLAAAALTACIFDKGGDYTGGGRRDIGAKAGVGAQTPPGDDGGSDNGGGGGGAEEDSGDNNPPTDSGTGDG